MKKSYKRRKNRGFEIEKFLKRKRKGVSIVLIVLLVGIISAGYFLDLDGLLGIGGSSSGSSGSSGGEPVVCPSDSYVLPDFDSLKPILETQPLLQEFPESGSLRLRFYHFTGPCRVWDKAYLITGGEVLEQDSEADLDMWIYSGYVSEIKGDNLCDVTKEAKASGDLGTSTELGTIKFTLKYGKMLKYRDCISS